MNPNDTTGRDTPGGAPTPTTKAVADRAGGGHWFEELAAHMGEAYLRYSFTKGTANEIDFLLDELELGPGSRVLDVGCGPGRHVRGLAAHGIAAHGIDISADFVDLARRDAPIGATFEVADARDLDYVGAFDAAICLCQGAFGLMLNPADDGAVLSSMHRAVRPGGRLALTAFHSYFVVKHFVDTNFDVTTGVSHELTEIRNPSGEARPAELWTGCYTVRELGLILPAHGWRVDAVYGVEPGSYRRDMPTVDDPELLTIATSIPLPPPSSEGT